MYDGNIQHKGYEFLMNEPTASSRYQKTKKNATDSQIE